jgi:hypothetical protein
VNTFIHRIIIDPEWYEIQYGIPTGFDPDRFLTKGPAETAAWKAKTAAIKTAAANLYANDALLPYLITIIYANAIVRIWQREENDKNNCPEKLW